MYKCQSCKGQSKAGEGQNKRIIETRRKTYENVVRRGKKSFTIKSEGSEIVREVAICTPCVSKLTK